MKNFELSACFDEFISLLLFALFFAGENFRVLQRV